MKNINEYSHTNFFNLNSNYFPSREFSPIIINPTLLDSLTLTKLLAKNDEFKENVPNNYINTIFKQEKKLTKENQIYNKKFTDQKALEFYLNNNTRNFEE